MSLPSAEHELHAGKAAAYPPLTTTVAVSMVRCGTGLLSGILNPPSASISMMSLLSISTANVTLENAAAVVCPEHG